MLQLGDVLESVIDQLYDRPFVEQYLVGEAHQAVPHVVLHLGYQLDAVDEQFLEQSFRYVAFVSDNLLVNLLDEVHGLKGLSVVHFDRSEHERENFLRAAMRLNILWQWMRWLRHTCPEARD